LDPFFAITPSSDLANDGAGVTASLKKLGSLIGSATSDVYQNSILKARDDLARWTKDLFDQPQEAIDKALAPFPQTKFEASALDGAFWLLGALARNARAVVPYEVGAHNVLKGRSPPFDGLVIHHAVQEHPAVQVIPDYNAWTAPSMILPELEHRRINDLKGMYNGSPRSLMARDAWNLRAKTDAPNEAIQELIDQNKSTYPGSFQKRPQP
jgi:hypothetical protein